MNGKKKTICALSSYILTWCKCTILDGARSSLCCGATSPRVEHRGRTETHNWETDRESGAILTGSSSVFDVNLVEPIWEREVNSDRITFAAMSARLGQVAVPKSLPISWLQYGLRLAVFAGSLFLVLLAARAPAVNAHASLERAEPPIGLVLAVIGLVLALSRAPSRNRTNLLICSVMALVGTGVFTVAQIVDWLR